MPASRQHGWHFSQAPERAADLASAGATIKTRRWDSQANTLICVKDNKIGKSTAPETLYSGNSLLENSLSAHHHRCFQLHGKDN
jgi:hypothetical protein